jgi:hypothetical protein
MPPIVRYYTANTDGHGLRDPATSFLNDRWSRNGGSKALSDTFVAELVWSLERAQTEISTMKAQIDKLRAGMTFLDRSIDALDRSIDAQSEVDYTRNRRSRS